MAKDWGLWLRELESFSQVPEFFKIALKNKKYKDLLVEILAGKPDQEENNTKFLSEQKKVVELNFKILEMAFKNPEDPKMREQVMDCGLIPRIFERLMAVSGEKGRIYEEKKVEEETKDELQLTRKQSRKAEEEAEEFKERQKKKRKGVGYSEKVGNKFDVTAYLANKKQRNAQIKILIDICTNFLNPDQWEAPKEMLDEILESSLMPILENAFRNGSFLEISKEADVFHSYLALTRAICQQKNLLPVLVEIDPQFKPVQTEPIYKLLAKLNDLAQIFLNCIQKQS